MKRKLYKFCLDGEQSRFCSKLCKRYASARVWGVIVVSLGTDRCRFDYGCPFVVSIYFLYHRFNDSLW